MRTLAVVFVCLFVATAPPPAKAETWDLVLAYQDGIWCEFSDCQLTFPGRTWMGDVGIHEHQTCSLKFSGTWAVCGAVDDEGVLCADQYATFVATGDGEGHISWAPNTPAGHTTQLLLGYRFLGDGAQTYGGGYSQENPWYSVSYPPVTGTLIVQEDTICGGESPGMWRIYSQMQHAFDLTYPVPEPAGLASLLMGLVGTGTLLARRRR